MSKRKIEQHDLVLFTINTGEFYQLHLAMARKNLGYVGWMDWLRDRVLPLYAKQVEPVSYDWETLRSSAIEIRDYYAESIVEMEQQARRRNGYM